MKKKVYIETNMCELPLIKMLCSYLIKKWNAEREECRDICGLSMPLYGELVDCCKENCPLVEMEEK